jgi:hypothetical protein
MRSLWVYLVRNFEVPPPWRYQQTRFRTNSLKVGHTQVLWWRPSAIGTEKFPPSIGRSLLARLSGTICPGGRITSDPMSDVENLNEVCSPRFDSLWVISVCGGKPFPYNRMNGSKNPASHFLSSHSCDARICR